MQKEPITQNGFVALEKKLEFLKNISRPKLLKDIKNAREFGDLKENAEYHAAKEELFIIDKKISALENQILNSEIIILKNTKSNLIVTFGSYVVIQNIETLDILNYQIVGEYESNIMENKISIKSPLAKSMILKSANDIIVVETIKNISKYKIMEIKYI